MLLIIIIIIIIKYGGAGAERGLEDRGAKQRSQQ